MGRRNIIIQVIMIMMQMIMTMSLLFLLMKEKGEKRWREMRSGGETGHNYHVGEYNYHQLYLDDGSHDPTTHRQFEKWNVDEGEPSSSSSTRKMCATHSCGITWASSSWSVSEWILNLFMSSEFHDMVISMKLIHIYFSCLGSAPKGFLFWSSEIEILLLLLLTFLINKVDSDISSRMFDH